MDLKRWTKILFVIVVFFLLFFSGLDKRDLWSPDEPRVAEIGREMAETGNFVVPTLNKSPFLEQPPLFYATLAVVFKIAGEAKDSVARIPPSIFGFAGVLATFLLGNFLFGRRVGLLSAFVLATSFEYFRVSHWVIVDSALSSFIYFATWAFAKAYFGKNEEKAKYYLLFHLFLILAFFVKGFIGLGVPFVFVLTFLLVEKNLEEIKRMRLQIGVSLFILLLGTWTFFLYRQGGIEHLVTFYIDNNLMRFLPGGTSGHHHPFYYYFREFPSGFMPWFLLLLPAFFYAFSKDLSHDKIKLRLILIYFVSGYILFSIAATKRLLYLLPIFAPASILVAVYIDHVLYSETLKSKDKIFLWIYGFFYLILASLLTPLAHAIAQKQGIEIKTLDIIALTLFSISLVALSLCALVSIQRRKMKKFMIFTSLCLFFLLLFLIHWVSPYVNEYKSFKPFVGRVLKEVPLGEPIYAYRPDETIRGFFPFYTGIYLHEIKAKEDLFSLRRKKGIYVIIRDKKGELSSELKKEGFVEIFTMDHGKERSLSLFRSK